MNRANLQPITKLKADYLERIFVQGLDSRNRKIGEYSQKPMYVSKSSLPSQVKRGGLKPRGKDGESKFKNGRRKKSTYFGGGYAEFRRTVGRQSKTVDLNLTGSLFGSFVTGKSRGSISLGFRNSESRRLSQMLEEKYGKEIFTVTNKEEDRVASEVEEMLTSIVEKAINKL